jgi:hypothetical protein
MFSMISSTQDLISTEGVVWLWLLSMALLAAKLGKCSNLKRLLSAATATVDERDAVCSLSPDSSFI